MFFGLVVWVRVLCTPPPSPLPCLVTPPVCSVPPCPAMPLTKVCFGAARCVPSPGPRAAKRKDAVHPHAAYDLPSPVQRQPRPSPRECCSLSAHMHAPTPTLTVRHGSRHPMCLHVFVRGCMQCIGRLTCTCPPPPPHPSAPHPDYPPPTPSGVPRHSSVLCR